MSINLTSKYLPLLDEVYKVNARTAVLETPAEFVRETMDAKTVLIAKVSTQGLVDYNRASGFSTGSVNVEWESHTFAYDRGLQFSVDNFDNIETLGMAFYGAAGAFVRDEVTPELDAVRFANYNAGAGKRVKGTLSASDVDGAIVDAETALLDAEVGIERVKMFISPTCYGYVKKSSAWSRPLVPSANPNRNFGDYDGMEVIVVPKARFYTFVTLQTSGSTGGYAASTASTATFEGDGSTKKFTITAKPLYLDGVTVDSTAKTEGTDFTYNASTGEIEFTTAPGNDKAIVATYGTGKEINFMLIDPAAVMQITKHAEMRVFDPQTNQKGNAYLVDYRIYHDAWVMENKKNGIFVHCKA